LTHLGAINIGVPVTTRNWNTITTLGELLSGE
jgi:hypothetical protein